MKVEKFNGEMIEVCILGEGTEDVMGYTVKIKSEDTTRVGCISREDVEKFKNATNLENELWNMIGHDGDELTWNSKVMQIPGRHYLSQIFPDKYETERIKTRFLTLSLLLSPNGLVGLEHPINDRLDKCRINRSRMNFQLDGQSMSFTSPFTERVFTIKEKETEKFGDGDVSGVVFHVEQNDNKFEALVRPYKGYNIIGSGHRQLSFDAYDAWEIFLVHQCITYYVIKQHPNIYELDMIKDSILKELFND